MKTIVRFFLAIATVVGTGLFYGCATPKESRSARLPEMSFSMKVVDSSAGRSLTPEEMKLVHDATIRFLARHEETLLGGTFYFRLRFTSSQAGQPGDWVLVQVISEQLGESARLAAYRTSPYYYPDYSGYGYAYASAYADPFYDNYQYPSNHGYYRPAPVIPTGGYQPHDRDNRNNGDRPHDRDNKDDSDRSHDRNRGDRPPGTYTGGDNRDHTWERHPRSGDYTPRSDDSHRGRGNDSGGYAPTTARVSDNSSGNSGGGNSGGGGSSSPPSSSYSPPSEPARSESSNSGVQHDSAQRQEN